MEIEVKVKAGKFYYSNIVYDLKDWAFSKEIIDKLFELNPEEKAPVAVAVDIKKPNLKKVKSNNSNRKGKLKKYPDEMKSFIKREINNLTNSEIVDYINKKWKCDITPIRLASFVQYNRIKRAELKTLPPENEDSDFGSTELNYDEGE